MKKLIILLVAAMSFTVAISAAKPKLTQEERAAISKANKERVGGLLPRPGTPMGRIAFVNAQSKVDIDDLKATFERNSTRIRGVDYWVDGSAPTVTSAKVEKEKLNAQFALFIIDDPALPMSLLAVEDGWAFLNVAAIGDANTKPELLTHRAKNEFARVFGLLCGGVSSQFNSAIMNSITNPKDLNGCTDELPVDVTSKMAGYLALRGVKAEQLTSYQRACQEGWAPPPTNDVQRAIWKKVHAIPDKPITIEFDPKKDK